MTTKSMVMLGLVVGSTLGGFVPNLWGADTFSYWSLVFSTLGGALGIWLGYTFGSD
jgi:uncharacterized membrane protein YeaQ/YmgE (transglycosylase-associated protein family)